MVGPTEAVWIPLPGLGTTWEAGAEMIKTCPTGPPRKVFCSVSQTWSSSKSQNLNLPLIYAVVVFTENPVGMKAMGETGVFIRNQTSRNCEHHSPVGTGSEWDICHVGPGSLHCEGRSRVVQ